MPAPGYAGKILRVNLSTKQINSIETSKYEAYGGGYGIATAIFWDLCVAPGGWDLQDPFDARNIVSLMTSPLTGSSVPFGSRTSVSGLAPQSWPISWFSRSNFGGSFAIMLKLAGWDGVVIEGKSDVPVYINIVDDKVTLEDAKPLWGLSTWETQEEIWRMQSANIPVRYGAEWQKLGNGYTTLRPAIVTIGPAGENMTRIGSLVHGAGSGAGQGGFGGVLGSKKLKAVAVIGTGSVRVADPKAVWDAREWYAAKWPLSGQGSRLYTGVSACMGCNKACRTRNNPFGNESNCMDTVWYNIQSPPFKATAPVDKLKGGDIIQKYGLNAFDTCFGGPMYFPTPGHPIQPSVPASTGAGWYFRRMYDLGIIGPGKKFDTHPLVMDQYETIEFAESYANAISKRIGIGNLLAEGVARFAEKIGRISDMNDILRCPAWGYVDHWTMPNVEWAYGTLTDSRDINNHDMQMGPTKQFSCEDYVKMVASETPPNNDPFAFDYSWQGDQAYKTGVYSDHKARFVAWRQHYAMFYKESVLYCDWAFANYYNAAAPGGKGATPEAEPVFFNAVTGKNLKFEDGIEIGRKIWNVKRAIFALQGRHRNMEKFAGFMYRPGASSAALGGTLPVYDGSKWNWTKLTDLYLDDQGVEQWKTAFYTAEGWDPKTGYPTRKTLEGLRLKHVADVLEARGKLGAA